MRKIRLLILCFLFIAPIAALSDLNNGDLPAETTWYFHADFEEMRGSDAGRQLYGWLQKEVFEEIREESGVDLDKEADYLTAFAAGEDDAVIIIEGDITRQTEDKVMAMGAASGTLDRLGSGNNAYFHIKDDDMEIDNGNIDVDVGSFDSGAYFSFAVEDKLIVTSTEERMQALLADKGSIRGVRGNAGDLFILQAERNLVQAGARTDKVAGRNAWDSNILRNTQQAALLIAEQAGKIAIQAQLVTTEAAMADSLASIVRGLISLQIFNDDMDPDVANFLQSTTVDVDDNKLTISVSLDPDVVVAAIE